MGGGERERERVFGDGRDGGIGEVGEVKKEKERSKEKMDNERRGRRSS